MNRSAPSSPAGSPSDHAFVPRVLAHQHIVGNLIVCATCGRMSHQRAADRKVA